MHCVKLNGWTHSLVNKNMEHIVIIQTKINNHISFGLMTNSGQIRFINCRFSTNKYAVRWTTVVNTNDTFFVVYWFMRKKTTQNMWSTRYQNFLKFPITQEKKPRRMCGTKSTNSKYIHLKITRVVPFLSLFYPYRNKSLTL